MPTTNRLSPRVKPSGLLSNKSLTPTMSRSPIKRSPFKADGSDRMIPNRGLMDFDYASYALLSPRFLGGDSRQLEANKAEAKPRPILVFGKNHITENDRLRIFQQTKAVPRFKLPNGPDRIMDAPGVLRGRGQQTICWNPSPMLVAALEAGVYGCVLPNCESVTEFQKPPRDSNSSDPFRFLSMRFDGKQLCGAKSSGLIHIWDLHTGNFSVSFNNVKRMEMYSVDWHRGFLTCGSSSGRVLIYDTRLLKNQAENKPVIELRADSKTGVVQTVAWTPCGRMLAAGTDRGTVNIWDKRGTLNPLKTLQFTESNSPIQVLAWCPWKQSVLATGTATPEPAIFIDNVYSGERCTKQACWDSVTSLCWNPNVHHLVSGHGDVTQQLAVSQSARPERGIDGTVELWNASSFKLQHLSTLDRKYDSILSMALSPGNNELAFLSADEYLSIWKCWKKEDFIKDVSDMRKSRSLLQLNAMLR